MSIGRNLGRRVVLLLAMVLLAATMATMSAASAFADDNDGNGGKSDSQLRHKIHVIQNRPGPETNQERNHVQNLKDRIQDNNNQDNNNDDDDD